MSDSIKRHPLVKKLQQEPSGTVRLQGYVGPSERDGYLSLYADLADLSECVEIPESAIVHHEEAPEEVLPYGGTFLWVKADAEVVYERSLAVRTPADMLSGAIAKAHLSDVQTPPITAYGLAPRLAEVGNTLHIGGCTFFEPCITIIAECPIVGPIESLRPWECLPPTFHLCPTKLPCISRIAHVCPQK